VPFLIDDFILVDPFIAVKYISICRLSSEWGSVYIRIRV
jgi:hypothetical protein